MSHFTSAFLGQVQHPINILQEYLAAFGNKCQAAILSWLDNWTRSKRKEELSNWIWLVLSDESCRIGLLQRYYFSPPPTVIRVGSD